MEFKVKVWLEEGKWAISLDGQIVIWRWSTERLLKLLKTLMDAATSRGEDA